MQASRLSSEEIIGLIVAVALHLMLLAALVVRLFFPVDPTPLPERVVVSLAEEVGPVDAAPDPVQESRAAIAPTLSDTPLAPSETTVAEPLPAPATRPVPATRAVPADTSPRRRPDRVERTVPQPRPSAAPTRSGGSRIGADFLPGRGDSTDTSETRAVGREFGAREQAALRSAITRQLRPHWRAPQGVDTEQLVTVLRWRLNKDGSLAGAPEVVSQSGVNDANRAQAGVHAERAIRAVQLAAPFDLPEEFYDKWSYIREWRFDRRL
ncbi:energy transducer TonB [Erythrobacter sp. HKB08]|uniref:energy transducer TonB n=1 Tax=Erythrobacter sp. HKB08 TaxID=2502843 RepID=UPI00100881C1|nr:energy transducer TonB [Erythrobacter sp. HKB08]